jgi:L-threonylcarbamoyladenylate synthase
MTMNKDGFKTQIKIFDTRSLAEAVAYLHAGRTVALPTETVYGLAADATSSSAVAEIYRAKNRPSFNPLIVHVADQSAAAGIGYFSQKAEKLAQHFWPGPLSMVVPLTDQGKAAMSPSVTAGLDTIALRCPAHPVMRAVLEQSALPLAAPSANMSGAISPTEAQHVADSLGDRVALVLDGGACQQGLESTIISVDDDGWRILRPGPITREEISALLGDEEEPDPNAHPDTVTSPGQLASHYAPSKTLRCNVIDLQADEWLIGFGDIEGDDNLSPTSDLAEAAANLYAALHRADASSKARIAIVPIPLTGIGIAINDRLKRAAH